MKLRTRLLLTLVALALLLSIPAIYALSRLTELRSIAGAQRTTHARALLQQGELTTNIAELDSYERAYIVEPRDAQRVGMERTLREARARLDTLNQLGYGSATPPAERVLAQLQQASNQVVRLVEGGRMGEATAYYENVKPLVEQAQTSLQQIARAIDERSRADVLEAGRISNGAARTTLAVLVVSLIAAALFGLYMGSNIARPILELRRTMGAVAEGDFAVPETLEFRRADEIGDLSRSFSWMTQQLRKLDQMKAEFISIATHELKTPINVIGGYAELLDEGLYGTPTPKQREAMQTIEEQTRVLTGLVNQLLDISRLEAGGLQLEMQDTVLQDLFARVERSFSVLARKKNIDFRVDVENSLPHSIHADADRITDQVLGNLLSNALKFTPEGGTIRVRAWGAPDGVHVEVRDSGVGVPQEQLPYIFDKFFQVGQQARAKGAGLGLAIAREIVEAHGGSIAVDSQPGRGTTFSFVLPVRQEQLRRGTGNDVVEKTA
ncbi:MAG TPA: HAMP domain-containing sensor histidine kinase [Longimicrobiales bacterium]